MNILLLLLNNWKYILVALAVSSVVGAAAYKVGTMVGYSTGHSAAVQQGITKGIETREKQNEVRNLRPDTTALLDGMRNGRF